MKFKSRSRVNTSKNRKGFAIGIPFLTVGLILLLIGSNAIPSALSFTDVNSGGYTRYSFWGYHYDNTLGGSFTAINGSVSAEYSGVRCSVSADNKDVNGNQLPGCWYPVDPNDPSKGYYGANMAAYFWPYIYMHTGIQKPCADPSHCTTSDIQFLQVVIADQPNSLQQVTATYPNGTTKTVMSEYSVGWAWCGPLGGDCAQGINIPIAPLTTHQLGLFYRNNGWDVVIDGATTQHFAWNYKAFEAGYELETHCAVTNPYCAPDYVIAGVSNARLSVVQDNFGKEDFASIPVSAAFLSLDRDGTANGEQMVCTSPTYVQVGGGVSTPPIPENCSGIFGTGFVVYQYTDTYGISHKVLSPSGQTPPSTPICLVCLRANAQSSTISIGGSIQKAAFVEAAPLTQPSNQISQTPTVISCQSCSLPTSTTTQTSSSATTTVTSTTTTTTIANQKTYSSDYSIKQPIFAIDKSALSSSGTILLIIGIIIIIVSLL